MHKFILTFTASFCAVINPVFAQAQDQQAPAPIEYIYQAPLEKNKSAEVKADSVQAQDQQDSASTGLQAALEKQKSAKINAFFVRAEDQQAPAPIEYMYQAPLEKKNPIEKLEDEDPFEEFNRLMFGINEVLEVLLLKPMAILYQALIPPEVRAGVSNAAYNLTLPIQSMAYFVAGEPERSLDELLRFGANSTFGLCGLLDASEVVGLQKSVKFDFDKALTEWGVPAGPYIVLPGLGGSTLRHLFTFVGEGFIDPINVLAKEHIHPNTPLILTGVQWSLEYSDAIERYGSGDSLRKSMDSYIMLREVYFGKRRQGTKAAYTAPKITMED